MMPLAASCEIASEAGSLGDTSGKLGRAAKVATTAWSAFMVIVSGRIGRHCATPSTVQPVKTAPEAGVTASVATAPAG